jgi:Large polyvalent protein-associated domain 7
LRNPANPGLFYFRDRKNDLAFSDAGIKLTTRHDDPIVADSMVAMAISRGWGSIRVSGSDEFKKEVWLQAQMAGLLTIGYIPTDVDYARLDAAKKNQADKAPASRSKNHSQPETNEPSISSAGERLVAHGSAPYEFDKRDGAKKSYFIKTEAADGKERIYWGVGLQDALTQSGVNIGDQITLKRLGKEQVVTDKPIWDESGKLLGHEPITTERNAWEIKMANGGQPIHSVDSNPGKVESNAPQDSSVAPTESPKSMTPDTNSLWAHKAKAFLNGDPKQVLGAFPELGKTLLAFKAAQSYFEKTVPNEQKRQEILAEIKQGLYARILSGNVPQVQIIDERKIGVLVDHGKTEDNSYFISYKDLFGKVQTLKDPGLEGAIKKTPLAIGQPIELSKSGIGKSISASSQKGDLLDTSQATVSAWGVKGGGH